MTHPELFSFLSLRSSLLCVASACLFGLAPQALAQPSLISTVPADTAQDVSPTTSVVFTFSEPMNVAATTADFSSVVLAPPFTPVPVPTTATWSVGNTVLTCKATAPAGFPANSVVTWQLDGENPAGDTLSESGVFMTGSGGGGTGYGTNAITSFVLGKIHQYVSDASGNPVPDPDLPYMFGANVGLASNVIASSITLRLPAGSVSNLTQNFLHKEIYYLAYMDTNLASLNNTFPDGNYSFTVQSTPTQTVPVTLPSTMQQPNAPKVSNFSALAAVDPTQPFVLSWAPFQGGAPSDFISVNVGSLFSTPDVGKVGALSGTATPVTIPAGTLPANSTNSLTIEFYRGAFVTNSSYVTAAYKATISDYDIVAKGSTPPPSDIVLTNVTLTSTGITFEIPPTTATVTVEYNVAPRTTGWLTLFTTNSLGAPITVSDPVSPSVPARFYRVRSGN
jgi:hypothetical protein